MENKLLLLLLLLLLLRLAGRYVWVLHRYARVDYFSRSGTMNLASE
jgi:hypothetical protein